MKQISIILVILLALAGAYWFKIMKRPVVSAPQENEVTEQEEVQEQSNFNFNVNGPVGTATGANGKYLTDKNGFTLYVNVKDENPAGKITQNCDAQCEKTWLPFLLGADEAAITGSTDALLSKLNLFKRPDGKEQYTIGTQPLYHYVGDLKAGDVTSNLGANWQVAKP